MYTVTFKSFVHDFDDGSNVMTLTEKVNDLNFTLLVYSFIHRVGVCTSGHPLQAGHVRTSGVFSV